MEGFAAMNRAASFQELDPVFRAVRLRCGRTSASGLKLNTNKVDCLRFGNERKTCQIAAFGIRG